MPKAMDILSLAIGIIKLKYIQEKNWSNVIETILIGLYEIYIYTSWHFEDVWLSERVKVTMLLL